MVKDSPLNITAQVKFYHDDVIEQQLAAIHNKTPYEESLIQYCAHDTKDEMYKEYWRKLKEYDEFRFKAIDNEKQCLAQNPEYHLEKLTQSRNA